MPAVRITVADQTITAQLADNPTAQDLTDQLPLTLTFRDFNHVEKVAELPRPLTMDGVPAGDDPDINDIGYYAPSRSLVFYYGDVGYWTGIVRIGRFTDQDIELIERQPDGFQVTIAAPARRRITAMNPTYDFTGQVALVTGGSSGMGLATARAFAEAGAAVAIADVNETTLGTAADELTAAGHRVLGVQCDVSDEDSVAAMVKATVDTFGRLDMAFNNAGIQVPPSDAADEPAEVFDRVNAINLRGVWACMKHELGQMRSQGSGAIVNCSSLGGLVGLPGRAAYHASKHGVIGLTTSAALEYAPRGIRINAICPGTIETAMVADMVAKGELDRASEAAPTPIGRIGRGEEIAASVLWLCSPGASFVVGVALPVDGGYTAQ